MQNIVESLRQEVIENLFKTNGFKSCWPTWKATILPLISAKTSFQVLNLGDQLKNIFFSTNTNAQRTQSTLASGGANWEGLVCWYLNLCLIGRRTVVIKHSKSLLPEPISNAITVNYMNFASNTESDLIAVTFPDTSDYLIDKDTLLVLDANAKLIKNVIKSKFNNRGILNALTHRDFNDLEIHIIQCKTNWNDNAQIPMLWDMIYSANSFKSNITIGRNGYSIHRIKRFTYSFVTVPTVNISKIKSTSTQVKRVTNISGGNYWGLQTSSNIASSIKEILNRNLGSGHVNNHLTTLKVELARLNSDYSYFGL